MSEGRTAWVRRVLRLLDKQGVDYCVLRNYEFLKGGDIDGDVDILIRERDRKTIDNLLTDLGFRRGRGDTSKQTTYLKFSVTERALLVLDIYWDAPTYNGMPLIDGDRMLQRARRLDGIAIPSKEDLFVELVFHGALNKNGYRESYHEQLDNLRQSVDKDIVREHARAVFGWFGEMAAESALDGEWDRLATLKWPFIVGHVLIHPSLIPTLIWNLLIGRKIFRPLQKAWRTYNPQRSVAVITLLGPDGAGKTTVSERVTDILQQNGFQVTTAQLGTYNDRTTAVSFATAIANRARNFVKRLRSREREENSRDVSNGVNETLPARRSKWKTAVHLVDIGTRYLRARIQTRGVIVADRFVHDVVAYDDVPAVLQVTFDWFEPDEFTGIVLVGDSETIASRSEYDSASIKRMQSDYRRLSFIEVNATQDVEAVVTDVLKSAFENGTLLDHSEYVI